MTFKNGDKFVKSSVVLMVTICVILLGNLVKAIIVDEMNGKSVEVVSYFQKNISLEDHNCYSL